MCCYLILLSLFLPLILAHSPSIGLRFADSTSSYILINPNMEPVQEKISICTWVHMLKSDGTPYVTRYNAPGANHEFILYGKSDYFYQVGQSTNTGIEAPLNQWHHQCITWSFQTRTSKFYYNGKLIVSDTTPDGRKLAMGGSIAIGQAHRTTTLEARFHGQYYSFGGELYGYNIFSKQLTDTEVSEIYKAGMCSHQHIESLSESYFLKWDTLLNRTPLHNVQKFNLPQCLSHTHQPTEPADPTTVTPTTVKPTTIKPTTVKPTTVKPTTAEPTTIKPTTVKPTTVTPTTATPTTVHPTTVESTAVTKSSRNESYNHWNILYHADFYNQEVTSELLDELWSLWEVLAEFEGHSIDDALIKHLMKHH